MLHYIWKDKIHPITDHLGPKGEYRYSSTLYLTSAINEVGGQRHDPAVLPPGNWAVTIMNVTNTMQLYRLIYFTLSDLHVSGDVFAHHQEHLTVFTVSGSIYPGCYRLVSWSSINSSTTPAGINLGEYYQIL